MPKLPAIGADLAVSRKGVNYVQRTRVGGWNHSGPVLPKFGKKEQARAAKRAAKMKAQDQDG